MSAPAVTVAPGVTVTADMSPTERYNAIAKSVGAPLYERPISPPQFHTDATMQRFAQGEAELAARNAPKPSGHTSTPATGPREDGTVSAPHAGMVAPTPEELAHANSLEGFDAEMRAKGIQKPLEPDTGQFQVDERTGIRVDVFALERAHELFRSMTPEERQAERADYEATLGEIYAGRLGLADMEDGPTATQPRDPQGRYAPASTPTYTVQQMEEAHAGRAGADGFIPLAAIGKWATSGYELPRLVPDQTYHSAIFADLAWARANGITQKQVEAFIADGMRKQGLIR